MQDQGIMRKSGAVHLTKLQKEAMEAKEKKQAAERVKKERESAARRQQIRAICTHVYKSTSDKKVSDLTVKEDQSVRSCQSLGLYPPR